MEFLDNILQNLSYHNIQIVCTILQLVLLGVPKHVQRESDSATSVSNVQQRVARSVNNNKIALVNKATEDNALRPTGINTDQKGQCVNVARVKGVHYSYNKDLIVFVIFAVETRDQHK